MCNEEAVLIAKVQAGDREAGEILVRIHTGYVKKVVTHWVAPSDRDYEDLLQAGYEGLWRAMREYDPAKATTFLTWARHKIRDRVETEFRRCKRGQDTIPLNGREWDLAPTPEEVILAEAQAELEGLEWPYPRRDGFDAAFGEYLRRQEFTGAQLRGIADCCEVTVEAVVKWFSGTSQPMFLDDVAIIAEKLGLLMDELVRHWRRRKGTVSPA
ncbi:MAG: RNA polymerase sigma factor [Candidatus Gottesmanbacteria bacterium GW2011_GWB1_49_7]|uniref:RNA polymerase sigma factor n=1 Tax=Candidatus Gottesmanbacteria bacterium GW2011_GWB1_49_7 TaxID=1618448 RepID=A0A0G1W3I9_9BACT|nr:MAG: RNA polymerase sigma factor [Candidatus Gottesmanbacteria bacterium GW2011_GWB1_49_7]